jgi:hypothetical protein
MEPVEPRRLGGDDVGDVSIVLVEWVFVVAFLANYLVCKWGTLEGVCKGRQDVVDSSRLSLQEPVKY